VKTQAPVKPVLLGKAFRQAFKNAPKEALMMVTDVTKRSAPLPGLAGLAGLAQRPVQGVAKSNFLAGA